MTTAPHLILIVGSQRSGTTLVNRLLNAHPQISIVYQQTDYLRDNLPMDVVVSREEATRAIGKVRERVLRHDPAFTDAVASAIEAALPDRISYGGLYRLLLAQLASPGAQVTHAGEKYAGRCLESFGFLDAFPDGRLIHIVRDPRDVLASEKARLAHLAGTEREYNHLLTLFDWKVGATAVELAKKEHDPQRVMTVRFEDLVQDPNAASAVLCDFLGVGFDASMTEADRLVDDAGKPWLANTSFGPGWRGIRRPDLAAWTSRLSPTEIAYAEAFCNARLRKYGYAPPSPMKLASAKVTHRKAFRLMSDRLDEALAVNATRPNATVEIPPRHRSALSEERILGRRRARVDLSG